MINSILSTIAAAAVYVASLVGLSPSTSLEELERLYQQQQLEIQQISQASDDQLLGAYNVTGGGTYRLKSSIGTSDATVNLSSFKEPVSNIKYTMAYLNTSIAYGTIDPSTTRSEFISFTGITQNSDGSAALTGVSRGLTRTPAGSACTASSTLAQRHPGQAVFILSDSPCHFSEYAVKKNDETITGDWKVPTPANSTSIANRAYVDGAAFGGIGNTSETATGTVEIATQGEAASSTQNGTLGRLVLPSSMATDTPNTTKASRVLMSDLDGLLKSAWLDLSTYTGKASTTQLTASGEVWLNSSTTLATTTIDVTKIVNSSLDKPLWSLLAATTTTQVNATTTISFPARSILKIYIEGRNDSNTPAGIYFNGDSQTNYSYAFASTTSLLSGGPNGDGDVGKKFIPINYVGGYNSSEISIYNPLSTRKGVIINTISDGYSVAGAFASTTKPIIATISGVWATSTTQQITSISLGGQTFSGGTGMYANTSIYIYGSSF